MVEDHNRTTIDFFQRMKYHILLALVISVCFMVLSYYYPEIFHNFVNFNMFPHSERHVELTFISLFYNNLLVILAMYIGGILLALPTLYLLIFNSCIIGYNGVYIKLQIYISYMFAHAPIELAAIILAAAAGFRLTQAEIVIFNGLRCHDLRNHVTLSKKMVKDSVLILLLSIFLLLMAAYLEAYLTIPIGNIIINYI